VKVVLIANYAADRQESMLRYASLLRDGLAMAGHEVTLTAPRQTFRQAGPQGLPKWIGYIDKYLLSPRELERAARGADVVHVCDHANSVYVPAKSTIPYVATCHDLLAVRGALGEDTDSPASFMGVHLQRAIVAGLHRAHAVACVSQATLKDVQRLLNGYSGKLAVVPNAVNYPYRRLDVETVQSRLEAVEALRTSEPYVLHVGSNLRRKNRGCVLRAFAAAKNWDGLLVIAGSPLDDELRDLATRLGVLNRIVEVERPDNETLEALYNGALAMLFPSHFEGFGWPLIEAQACGCPVICSDREPMPEVTGNAAILCDADDAPAFARAIVELAGNDSRRTQLVAEGLQNAARYDTATMTRRFVELYEQIAGA